MLFFATRTRLLPLRSHLYLSSRNKRSTRILKNVRRNRMPHEDLMLAETAAAKNIPVEHYDSEIQHVDQLTVPEIKEKHYPFFGTPMQRMGVPYYRDSSLEKAEINKNILRVFPPNKSAEFWSGVSEEKKARSRLPVPISMTGLGLDDGSSAKYWTAKIRNMIDKLEKEDLQSDSLLDDVTPAVRLMLEQNSEDLTEDEKQLQRLFEEAKQQPQPAKEDELIVFPHQLRTRLCEKLDRVIIAEQQRDTELLDKEYKEYMKHRNVMQYMCEGLKKAKRKDISEEEFESEMEGWRDQFWRRSYGTPDPSVPASNVPCGGCGALMHCSDPGLPGYLPSEKFKPLKRNMLKKEICQRCEFLEHFNVSIDVNVPPGEYSQILSKIRDNKSVVVLMVDLTDFPCSIWPGIVDVIGKDRKIFVVGNKVDLLPCDSKFYLDGIVESLKKSLHYAGFNSSSNAHYFNVSLISAKTGFGVEHLVTRLLKATRNKREDIYLIGCTNVGKSTLFNALLQSDLCAARENDLIQRATTSLWPGTTLNLLKFPINRLQGYEQQMREERLFWEQKVKAEEYQLRASLYRQTGNPGVPAIVDRVGMTFRQDIPFTVESDHPFAKRSSLMKPFSDRDARFRNCGFLFDSPGTVYEQQLLSLLTTEELLKSVPRSLITPRTFSLQPYQTLFIAGLARLDVVSARQTILVTVFASQYLPIHVVYTQEASRFYHMFLGSELLAVPRGGPERLQHWPDLMPKEVDLKGIGSEESCGDIVLSSTGWISVTMPVEDECVLKAYTPGGRGIFVRQPSLLPLAVNMKGRRIRGTPCHETRVSRIDEFDEEVDPKAKRLAEKRSERAKSYNAFRMRHFTGHDYGWHEVNDDESSSRS